jgi:hypothetical protein
MAVEDAIAALAGHWDDVMARLGPERAGEVRDLVGRLGGPGHDDAVSAITDILIDGLPSAHAVRRALAAGDVFQAPVADWPAITALLRDRAARATPPAPPPSGDDGTDGTDGEPPTAAEILRAVTGRLLAAPALTEQEVRRRGGDPADPGLIRLERPDGGWQWPDFQFAPGNGPLPVVRAINDLLGAASDPIGVAGWWLTRNGWLGGRPCLLLGTVPDDVLLSAARAVGSEA